ncbi:polysaccharide biosynthesis protein [Terrisporobacter mayombei]|uniref:UDP-N-acetyl-alpha-D-glucosamine C6 dehydratase n=1 Tax=Terrisporobacter mayombei TaxID=1541 RepID=A0ABY9QA71_9FIRM|nr:nucleoside-diphosphate sugar epimerase/dehydratase [Terrisporobacter mayombei]MCC3869664.1 polysaccharide biosynthesis protein [Terrisporobacter mayombei]WMT83397.1 UDP-N-acetyl-alpha-D-glucosamine C6 dehydratase [Terrisporobacter mayombei]
MGYKILGKINYYSREYGDFRYRQGVLLISDTIIFIGAFIISLSATMSISYLQQNILLPLITMIIICLTIFSISGIYRTLWSTSVDREIIMILLSTIISTFSYFIIFKIKNINYDGIFYVTNALLIHVGMCSIRILYRTARKAVLYFRLNENMENRMKVLVVGAGSAGNLILKEMFENPQLNMYPVGIIDDNENKLGKSYYNVPVIGTTDDIEQIAQNLEIDEIIFSIAKITRKRKREIMQICKKTKCKIKTIPGIYELIDGKVGIKNIREVNIEDLLGRESVKIRDKEVLRFLKGKKVLVTGAGGSIGSELCRQISSLNPDELILVDIYENNVYELQQELIRKYKNLDLKVLIASVRDKRRMEEIFINYQPEIVFHAAAHKHVPLMEDSPCEAIKNNVFGTLNVAELSAKYKVKRFVLISTDKAVNPTNIMGATKRCCEMIVQTLNKNSETEFVAVRFGNVLGSNGSVVPLFKKQIEGGGPVKVTHPEITRFFMTISEAVSLVLEAGTIARGGEIFVLNMGEPVKILDLAKNLISLSGLEPDVDIKIEFTGLRPGEKLYEEILMDEEGLRHTGKDKIYVGQPIEVNEGEFFDRLRHLKYVSEKEYGDEVRYVIKELVPTYIIKEKRGVNKVAITG